MLEERCEHRDKELGCLVTFDGSCSKEQCFTYQLMQKLEFIEEICPHCDSTVELPPYLGIYECPVCGKLIVSCASCENAGKKCHECKFDKISERR